MVKIPSWLKETSIKDMRYGETGWTVPWAMYEIHGQAYINGNYTAHKKQGGTVSMLVTRIEAGAIVDVSECLDYRWGEGEGFHDCSCPLPVFEINGACLEFLVA